MNILFIASEVESFVKTGGLADVAKALPLELKRAGHDVRIIIPGYSAITQREQGAIIASGALATEPQYVDVPYEIRQLYLADIPLYLVENKHYFERPSLYGENNNAYADNGERFAFFSAAALHATEQIGFRPDIVHCNDWHTALVPMLLKTRFARNSFFEQTKSVISIHNGAFQGVCERGQLWALPEIRNAHNESIYQGPYYINFLKCGVLYADKINAVSPTYAKELMSYLGGHGMAKQFQDRAADICGIINGCDYNDWDPATDHLIPAQYHVDDLQGKAECKRQLQLHANLPVCDLPMFGMVCRLTEQKGIHYLLPILAKFLVHHVQLVIVGSGDPILAQRLEAVARQFPQKFVFFNAHSNELAHLVEAGSDFFMMPSQFEPCGLNQMYSLAYGTLPIVRAVGGLKDTVTDYDQNPTQATGFVFEEPEPHDLLNILRRALLLYVQDQQEFRRVQRNAMLTRYLWSDSVHGYEAMYRNALGWQ